MASMAKFGSFALFFILQTVFLFSPTTLASDPFAFFNLELSYISVSPLGVPQQVIAVNSSFPGPVINVTTNYNVVVNVWNKLDENLLLTWNGIQMRRSSWQDGVLGTNCPIPPDSNWTYQFQVKDQIGSFFYHPSLGLQRASGGFGSFIITNRPVIPIPFAAPDGDIVLLIGDWYVRDHKALREALDSGSELGVPDGVLINGRGPYRYNNTLVPDGIVHETVNVDPGKTYRIRVHNVGVSTCLNFRIQGHNLVLAESEGVYTQQQGYTSMDIHVGQSYTFLVTMNQNASNDYYIVASARFASESVRDKVTGVAILHYSNSTGSATGPLPDPPSEIYDTSFGLNQAMSVRQNVTASGARPNPQGSFHYGQINVTDTYMLKIQPLVQIDGRLRSTFNGISYANPDTPIRLADSFNLSGIYKTDFPSQPPDNGSYRLDKSIIEANYKGFIEIIMVNDDAIPHSFHLDGYSFFVVGMGTGNWTESSRGSYNRWDALSRSTTQVFPGGWTSVFVSLDNVGVWNLRSENLDRWYLGEETYMKIVNPEDHINKTELPRPENALYCGALANLRRKKKNNSSAVTSFHGSSKVQLKLMLMLFVAPFLFW
ncbi:OLC1v1005557C1 [Oldenlandia corymbosa var. corymbosa]|uniref:OLC1v1005557C1 n=1 Tax=Oldenlandia corymbosa var. corymbosa TaxID=529605 RepID=A0AAV1DHK2_OLDCO|nr:OLC1v1005557C1 [Oldenlandia corymbosa var. corymbosa]